MKDKVFIDTNILIYLYSEDEIEKQQISENLANKYSYYDSLIISSAIENKCNKLYSEDMQHGQSIENQLKIINPFT